MFGEKGKVKLRSLVKCSCLRTKRGQQLQASKQSQTNVFILVRVSIGKGLTKFGQEKRKEKLKSLVCRMFSKIKKKFNVFTLKSSRVIIFS